MTPRNSILLLFLASAFFSTSQSARCPDSDIGILLLGGFNYSDSLPLWELDSVKACDIVRNKMLGYFAQAFGTRTQVAISLLDNVGSPTDRYRDDLEDEGPFITFADYRRIPGSWSKVASESLDAWCNDIEGKYNFRHREFTRVVEDIDMVALKEVQKIFTYERGMRPLSGTIPRLLVVLTTRPLKETENFRVVRETMESMNGRMFVVSWKSNNVTDDDIEMYGGHHSFLAEDLSSESSIAMARTLTRAMCHVGEVVKREVSLIVDPRTTTTTEVIVDARTTTTTVLSVPKSSRTSSKVSEVEKSEEGGSFGADGPLERAATIGILFCVVAIGGVAFFFV